MPTDSQLFACGAYADFGDGDYYAPPAVAERRQAAPYRLRDLLPPAPDVESTRRRLRDLLGDAPPDPPLISVVEIDGQRHRRRGWQRSRPSLRRSPRQSFLLGAPREGESRLSAEGKPTAIQKPALSSMADHSTAGTPRSAACWLSRPRPRRTRSFTKWAMPLTAAASSPAGSPAQPGGGDLPI